MDFSTLPSWPIPFPGESRQSWLTAACAQQPLDPKDWWEIVQPSLSEPERQAKGVRWAGLPSPLGEISVIAPTWRLAARHRRIYCPDCFVQQGDQRRWPVLIAWLDARRLQCPQHGCPLVYRDPAHGLDPGQAKCLAHPELLELYAWTRHWLRIERMSHADAHQECLWRRDLVHMICRNWTPARCHSAAGLGAWELCRMGWYGQEMSRRLNSSEPGRLGVLSAPERLGTLLLAYRTWYCFQSYSTDVPRLPPRAWHWLRHRWLHRLKGDVRRRFLSVVRRCGRIDSDNSRAAEVAPVDQY